MTSLGIEYQIQKRKFSTNTLDICEEERSKSVNLERNKEIERIFSDFQGRENCRFSASLRDGSLFMGITGSEKK